MALHHVTVIPLPDWLPPQPLLGPGSWVADGDGWTARIDTAAAADLQARLHKVVLAGKAVECRVRPSLKRKFVRQARTDEARRKRAGSPSFTRKGVVSDDEARAWITPEVLALQLGKQTGRDLVIDACCGLGGNAIGFARAGSRVIAIEAERHLQELARWNANIYKVADRIDFQFGRAEELVKPVKDALLFVDPPWGPDYREPRVLDDYPLLKRLLQLRMPTWAKLPPSFDPQTVPNATAEAWFGVGEGDNRRVKFLLLKIEP